MQKRKTPTMKMWYFLWVFTNNGLDSARKKTAKIRYAYLPALQGLKGGKAGVAS